MGASWEASQMRSGAILQFPVQNNIMMAHYERGGSVVDSLTLSLLRATLRIFRNQNKKLISDKDTLLANVT